MEFTKLLEERRSIRAFDPEKHVTAEQIQEIVQAAIQAPSWKKSKNFPQNAFQNSIRRVQREPHLS